MHATVAGTLQHALAAAPPGAICVGYSGGVDSTALLHALAALPGARARGLRALHVDHGLNTESAVWAERCRAFAATLDVPLTIVRVHVDVERGRGLEAAAREARHAAFGAHLAAGELLALAHHRDDQSETLLLKLLRGAGPEGLGAMRALRDCSAGRLWRPLLALPRAALLDYARSHALPWIDDPSNADARHARNFLRSEVLPLLRRRWPQLDTALGHSARWLAHTADYLDDAALAELARLRGLDPTTLAWRRWLELPDALRANALRAWLRDLGLPAPEHLHVEQLERQLALAESDRVPCVAWAGAQIRRYREWIYAMPPLAEPPDGWRLERWTGDEVELPADCGRLSLQSTGAARAHGETIALTIDFGRRGERLRPAGDRHTRDLRDLWQQAGVPPWRRDRVPLVRLGERLLAVGDYWLSDDGAAWLAERGLRIAWSGDDDTKRTVRD